MTHPSRPSTRLASIDILRGIVVVLMAIDHVRVYSGLPAGGATPGIFFTRWVTHFCAPLFVFLAGTGAYLHGRALGDTRPLARYLVTRGLMLVVLELTLIRFLWSFNPDLTQFVLLGVIWMLGWCMVLMAGLVRFQPRTVGWLGVAIVVLQPLFGLVTGPLPERARAVLEIVYPQGVQLGKVNVLYVLVPWIGVMAAGYGFGAILVRDEIERRRLLLRIGLGMTVVFLVAATAQAVMAGSGGATDQSNQTPPLLFRILNQRKYPASPLFLLMTIGPAIALMPSLERASGRVARALETFGRVPLFYYLLHIPLIHVSALVVNAVRSGAPHNEWYLQAPYTQVPAESKWSLGLLYLVFVIDVALLYMACRWYAGLKARRTNRLLRLV